jgi:hypothetical protein
MKKGLLATTALAGLLMVAFNDRPVTAQTPIAAVNETTRVPETVSSDFSVWVDRIAKLRTGLEGNGGFLRLKGDLVDVLVFDREAGKKLLLSRYQSSLESAAVEMPADFFSPLDRELDGLWAEIERLAPNYTLPAGTTPRSANVVAIVAQRLKGIAPDAEVVQTVMLEEKMAYGKVNNGAAFSRRSTGLVLYKVPGLRYAICREFVLQRAVAGSGATVNNYDVKFGGVRIQTES